MIIAILNYTTTVAAAKSIGEIQAKLAASGAAAVTVLYREFVPVGLAFALETPVGHRTYRLPANIAAIEALLADIPRAVKTRQQALKVSWRILRDWVYAQLAIIQAGMVTIDEVMLPYLETTPGGPLLYEAFMDHGMKLLTAGGGDRG